MSETRHTPGPWKLELATDGFRRPSEDGARDMMIVAPDLMCPGIVWDSMGLPQQAANARLIASAPCMLSALKAMDAALTRDLGAPDSILSSDPNRSILLNDAWIQIRSVLSRAEAK